MLDNVHPGEVLLEEFLKPLGLSQNSLARAVNVPPVVLTRSCMGNEVLVRTPL